MPPAGGREHMNMVPMSSDRDDPIRLPITPGVREKYNIIPQRFSSEFIAVKYSISQNKINESSVTT